MIFTTKRRPISLTAFLPKSSEAIGGGSSRTTVYVNRDSVTHGRITISEIYLYFCERVQLSSLFGYLERVQ